MDIQSSDTAVTEERPGLLQLLQGKTKRDERAFAELLKKITERRSIA